MSPKMMSPGRSPSRRKPKDGAESDTGPIVLRTTRLSDLVYVLVGLGLGLSSFWRSLTELWPGRFAGWPDVIFGLLYLAVGIVFLGIGLGGAWRLADRRPALVATAEELSFHPSLRLSPVRWTEITGLHIVERRYFELQIDFARRFLSLQVWPLGRSLRISLWALGLEPKEARAMIRRIKALAKAPES